MAGRDLPAEDDVVDAGAGRFHYEFGARTDLDPATSDLPAAGPVVRGERLRVGKRRLPAGSAPDSHHHATEQFTLVERGSLRSHVAGERAILDDRHLVYVPPDTDHRLEVIGEEDAVVYFVTPRADLDLAADESLNEALQKPVLAPGEDGYHFDLVDLDRRLARTGYGTSTGFYVQGALVQVGYLRYAPGDGPGLHAHPNEMVNLGLSDGGRWHVGGREFSLDAGEVALVPPDVTHGVEAPPDRAWQWFAAKDTSYRMFGKSLDG